VDEISEYVTDDNKLRKKPKAKIYFYVLSLFLFAIIVVLAVTVGNLGSIFNLVGAIASNSVGFIFPTLFYMVIVVKQHRKKRIHFWVSLALFCIALPFGIFAVASEFII
jgi:amino acid permease